MLYFTFATNIWIFFVWHAQQHLEWPITCSLDKRVVNHSSSRSHKAARILVRRGLQTWPNSFLRWMPYLARRCLTGIKYSREAFIVFFVLVGWRVSAKEPHFIWIEFEISRLIWYFCQPTVPCKNAHYMLVDRGVAFPAELPCYFGLAWNCGHESGCEVGIVGVYSTCKTVLLDPGQEGKAGHAVWCVPLYLGHV